MNEGDVTRYKDLYRKMNFGELAIGQYVRLVRIAKGLSIDELSKISGVIAQTVQKNESRKNPGKKGYIAEKLLSALEYPDEMIMDGRWVDRYGLYHILPGLYGSNFKKTTSPMYVKLARARRGISLKDLSLAVGVSQGLLIDYESYAVDPELTDFYPPSKSYDVDLNRRIAEALGYPEVLLFSDACGRDEYIL